MHTGLACQLCDLYIVTLKIVSKERKKTQNIVLGKKLFGVPQGSMLGSLLFHIFLCDLFLIMENIGIASYADDNTPYTTGNAVEEVIQKLENAAKTVFQWFSNTQMKTNPDRCHFM